MKLTKRHMNALRHLANRGGWTLHSRIPDGNGHCSGNTCASTETMRELEGFGFVQYGKEPQHSLFGYRITDAIRALEDAK